MPRCGATSTTCVPLNCRSPSTPPDAASRCHPSRTPSRPASLYVTCSGTLSGRNRRSTVPSVCSTGLPLRPARRAAWQRRRRVDLDREHRRIGHDFLGAELGAQRLRLERGRGRLQAGRTPASSLLLATSTPSTSTPGITSPEYTMRSSTARKKSARTTPPSASAPINNTRRPEVERARTTEPECAATDPIERAGYRRGPAILPTGRGRLRREGEFPGEFEGRAAADGPVACADAYGAALPHAGARPPRRRSVEGIGHDRALRRRRRAQRARLLHRWRSGRHPEPGGRAPRFAGSAVRDAHGRAPRERAGARLRRAAPARLPRQRHAGHRGQRAARQLRERPARRSGRPARAHHPRGAPAGHHHLPRRAELLPASRPSAGARDLRSRVRARGRSRGVPGFRAAVAAVEALLRRLVDRAR